MIGLKVRNKENWLLTRLVDCHPRLRRSGVFSTIHSSPRHGGSFLFFLSSRWEKTRALSLSSFSLFEVVQGRNLRRKESSHITRTRGRNEKSPVHLEGLREGRLTNVWSDKVHPYPHIIDRHLRSILTGECICLHRQADYRKKGGPNVHATPPERVRERDRGRCESNCGCRRGGGGGGLSGLT